MHENDDPKWSRLGGDLRLADVLASMGELKKARFGMPQEPEVIEHNMAYFENLKNTTTWAGFFGNKWFAIPCNAPKKDQQSFLEVGREPTVSG